MAKKTLISAVPKSRGFDRYKIAVLVPCYNEAVAVAKVFRILRTIVNLYRAERPLTFFNAIGLALAIASIGFAIPIFVTFLEAGLVPRLPTAILSTGLMMLTWLSVAVGLVLDTVTRGWRETKLLAYLAHRAPGEEVRQG